jgi:hypothetical protein
MTQHPIPLPALDGRDPLGFLAALGATRLLTDHHDRHTALAFDPHTATAILHTTLHDLDQVADTLTSIIEQIPADAVIPGLPPGIPTPPRRIGGDPMRAPRHQHRDRITDLTTRHPNPAQLHRWLGPLLTDLAVDAKDRTALSPYLAPVGQQSLRNFFGAPLAALHDPDRIRQALTGWVRVPGITGESLDHRAIRNAADQPDGTSKPAGVPGATWLATMAIPLLRLTGNGTHRAATGWHHHTNRRAPILIWPIWRPPLDTHAIQTLLEHPALTPQSRNDTFTINLTPLRPLGVIAVYAAERLPLVKNSDGILAPTPITTTHT